MRGGTTFLGIHMPLGGQGSQLQVPSMRRSPPPPSMLVTWIPLGGTPDGFRESARHVPVLSWVAAEISAFNNQLGRCIRHPLGCGERVSGGGVGLRAFNSWNLFSLSLNSSGVGRDRGNA